MGNVLTSRGFNLQPNLLGAQREGLKFREQQQQLGRQNEARELSGQLLGPQRLSVDEENQQLAQLFTTDPNAGLAVQKQLGLDTASKRRESLDFAFLLQNTPFEQRGPLIDERERLVTARGGNASDTASLRELNQQDQDRALRTVQLLGLPNDKRLEVGKGKPLNKAIEEFQFLAKDLTPEEVRRAKLKGLNILDDPQKALDVQAKTDQKNLDNELKASKTKFDQASKIRSEVSKAGSEFEKVKAANARIGSLDVSAAGDLALIFNFMKMLDPGSVVRESEFATAANAAGVPDRVRNTFNRLLTGERLGDDQRLDFLNQAKNLFKAAEDNQIKKLADFVKLGKRFGLEEADIIVSPIKENDLTPEEQADLQRLEAKFGNR